MNNSINRLDILQNPLESETLVPNITRLKPSFPSFARCLLHNVFFYGLYMDEEILKSKGIVVRNQRKASISNYALRLANLATLLRKENSTAYGMVYAMTQKELHSLYEGSGLNEYVTEALLCTLDDGSKVAVLCKNLVEVPKEDESNDVYFLKLKKCMETYDLVVPINV